MGSYIYHSLSHEDSQAAIEHFERAISLDPNFALAHCALGGVYANRVIKGSGDKDDYARATASFTRALALDAHLIEARMHMVFIYLARGEKSEARARSGASQSRGPERSRRALCERYAASFDGEYPEALREFELMLRLNPAERVVVSYNRARIFLYQRRYDDALLELSHGAASSPDHPLVKTFQAFVLYFMGEIDRAAEILREVLARQPKLHGIRPILAMCLSAQGRHEEARRELDERVKANAEVDHDVAYWLASAYAVEGERGEAIHWLGRAIELGNENRTWFESDPNWAALRSDPGFQDLMRRIAANRVSG
ncbi:MAG: tetratricopeptide repeat protein [Pyrinomonadaceae bacterium]